MAIASAFECATWYQASAATGKQILFLKGKNQVAVEAQDGGVFWIKPTPPGGAPPGTAPTSPIPAAGQVAQGWVRVAALTGNATFGIDGPSGTEQATPNADAIWYLDVWCETAGTLAVLSH